LAVQAEDRNHVSLNSKSVNAIPHGDIQGVSIQPLYVDEFEEVSIQNWEANPQVTLDAHNGVEILVLEGDFTEDKDALVKHSWLRLPIGNVLNARAGSDGAKVWIKQNHLPLVDSQIERVLKFDNG